MANDPNINSGVRKNLDKYNSPYDQAVQSFFDRFDNGKMRNPNAPPDFGDVAAGAQSVALPAPPVAAPGVAPATGLNKAAQNTISNARHVGNGIYEVTNPEDGSTVYTNQPGGTFVRTKPEATPPRPGGGVVNNALYGPGVQTRVGEMGTGTGNFSAAEATSPSKFRYILPTGGNGVDAGAKAGLTPGTTAWINANTAPVNPLESQDAADQAAANSRALNDFRRGDGKYNSGMAATVYDPSGYNASNVPGVGGAGFGGMNPIDTMLKLSHAQAEQERAAAATSRAGTDAREAVANEILKLAGTDDIKARAARYEMAPNDLASVLYAARHPTDDMAEANARKIVASHMVGQINKHYGVTDWVHHLFGGAPPEPAPVGDNPELNYQPGYNWAGRRAMLGPPRDREGNITPNGTRNYVMTSPFWGKGGAEFLADEEAGPYVGKLFSQSTRRGESRLKEIAAQAAEKAKQ